MADDKQVVRGIDWRETFPFTNIFRSFRIAIHPSKLFLAIVFLILIYGGGWLLDFAWPNKYLVTPGEQFALRAGFTGPSASSSNPLAGGPLSEQLGQMQQAFTAMGLPPNAMGGGMPSDTMYSDKSRGVFSTFINYEIAQVDKAAAAVLNGNWLGSSDGSVVESVTNFVITGPRWLVHSHWVFAIIFGLYFLILLSVFGGAIARIAAVHVARDEKISVRQALRFSTGKVLSFLFAPLIPLIILLVLAALLAVGGLLLYVPWVGPIAVGAAFFLALGAAFIMTMVVFGTIGGFSLMYPTVAVEGSDSFDAISRSFSYIFARPWRTIFYSAIALAYGSLTYLFVRYFLVILLTLTHCSVGWFLKDNTQPHAYWEGVPVTQKSVVKNDNGGYLWKSPDMSLGGSLTYEIPYSKLKWTEDIAATLIKIWVGLTVATLGAFAISFYFSSTTIIYYLLRKEVDATEMDDVYVEQADEDFTEPTPEAAPNPPGFPVTAAPAATTPVDPTPPPTTEPPANP